ncbi:helix-turn-helix transcriptional regulator [Clostridium sp. CCUG 7971]|uniref:helix-turn-helix domain-containing protein n=1 Tax=Clostridium sp. CCUG 7971 TaxID=2811414 RepID=UPI001ABA4EA0|nr:helix-turn-helix transcriptional regulator [Clostridium sp. CCUG 7971]MBO3446380.1 helix-turn-helix transcriptional regulator [Clostridium sp. CCUG 7971]
MKDLIDFRISLKLTQREMANEIGVSKSYYQKVEGSFKKPGRGFIEKFKETFPNKDIGIFF